LKSLITRNKRSSATTLLHNDECSSVRGGFVTVGETLTEARSHAGLSVEELSERTRIRGTVIRSIEQDDFEACGGDLYVRGYVRAIAGAVGIDAQPLIREFDLGRSGGSHERANGSTGRHAMGYPGAATALAAETSFDLPAVDPQATSFDLPRVPAPAEAAGSPVAGFPAAEYPTAAFAAPVTQELVTQELMLPTAAVPPGAAETRYDMPAVPEDSGRAALDDLMAAGYDLPPAGASAGPDSGTQIMPAIGLDEAPAEAAAARPAPGQRGPGPADTGPAGAGRKRRRGLFAVAAAVVLVAAGALAIHLATGNGSTGNVSSASTAPSVNASAASAARASAAAAAQAQASAAAQASASAAAQASASAAAQASASAAAQRVVTLPVASVTAVGPGGAADGDDPGGAAAAIAAHPAQLWSTQWYATPQFGMLKHGTGLLLDLGSKVTVTTVRLDLAPDQGADLQLRVGNGEALQDLTVAATANNAGGALTLTLHHPVAARYLLIWITQLPADGSGHYAETVSHVSVTGRR
jgi:hypothetical protein